MNISDKKIERITQVAKLYYNDNLTQNEIADNLKISRPMVSVLLNEARSLGIVTITVNDVSNTRQLHENRIKDQFNFKNVIVVKDGKSPEETDINVSKTALQYCFEKAKSNASIGIGWGSMIGKMTDYAQRQEHPLHLNGKIFPLIGGIGATYRSYHTNEIIRILSTYTGLEAKYCYLPAFFNSAEEKKIVQNLQTYREYKENCATMNMAIISISNYPSYPDLGVVYRYEDLLSKHKSVGRLLAHYYDAMGQIILPKVDNAIQVSIEELKKTSNVTAICSSLLKPESLIGALRVGVIKNVIIPESLAAKIII
ncbi:sugar-binding domain-containing protein [Oscillospiraceae bacterium PP1C4]